MGFSEGPYFTKNPLLVMSRLPSLKPYQESGRNRWVLRVPGKLTDSGKVKREIFSSEKAALERVEEIKKLQVESANAVRMAGAKLIRDAVDYDELFRDVYGFEGGLGEACEQFIRQLDERYRSIKFQELVDNFEAHHKSNWSRGYTGKWKWFRKHLEDILDRPVLDLDLPFWRNWLANHAEKKGWQAKTYNEVAGILSSIWKDAVRQQLVERNPIEGVARRKVQRTQVAVYTVEQVKALMECAWKHDREMVPYFAIAIFAGLRPDVRSEITRLDWEDVDFEHKQIRVGKNFDNKTGTRRFVEMEENLLAWLEPWKNATGPVVPPNLVRRRRYLTRGKYQSPEKTPSVKWKELVPNGEEARDITRHTYGSYLEAKYRNRNKVMANMGHLDTSTYEQHYRNARSPQEAEAFWDLRPPADLQVNQEEVLPSS